jgi:ABC-type cobalt transport system substrate-binding protein
MNINMFTCGIVLVILVLIILTLYKIDKKETYKSGSSGVDQKAWQNMINAYKPYMKPTCTEGYPQCPPFWNPSSDCGPNSQCTPNSYNTNEIGGSCITDADCGSSVFPIYCSYGFCTVNNSNRNIDLGNYPANLTANQCINKVDNEGNEILGRTICQQNFPSLGSNAQCSSDLVTKDGMKNPPMPGLCFFGQGST